MAATAVAAALCARALGKENVIGVMLPDQKQADIADSVRVCESIGIQNYTINIGEIHTALLAAAEEIPFSEESNTNVAPRLRMTTLYAISQSLNGRVANTCNLSEDWVGYSTRYGDAAGDFSPLGGLTVAEVKAIGREMGLPVDLVDKTPSDGLSGKSDEDNLGFTYAVLDRYIRTGVCDDPKTKAAIDEKHVKNLFKLQPIPHFDYNAE